VSANELIAMAQKMLDLNDVYKIASLLLEIENAAELRGVRAMHDKLSSAK
jgi:hypothetical protein